MIPSIEFSRLLAVARIPAKGTTEHVEATPAECAALATRFKLPSVQSVKATLRLSPWRGRGVKAEGHATANIEHVSVVSLENFMQTYAVPVERYFLEGAIAEADDADPIEGGTIDLGEIVAETLAMELDPYPRKPGEVFPGFDSQSQPEAAVSPFTKLSKTSNSDD
jgi:uncharacterized metal-binding protein YceD (DUF177 family)